MYHFRSFILFVACLLTGIPCLLCPAGTVIAAEDESIEEIVVNFKVRRLINEDIFVQYRDETVYLPVQELFDLLDLKITSNAARSKFTGYVISENQKFEIDLKKHRVKSFGKTHSIHPEDYLLTTTDLYLRVDFFESYFGLPFIFRFTDLQVILPLNEEFPAYQKMKRAIEHKLLKRKKRTEQDIYQIRHNRPILGGAVLDWSLSANTVGGGGQYFSFNTGAMVAGGDLNVAGTGNSDSGFDPDQMTYRWHYFVDTASYVTQMEFGDIYTYGSLGRRLRGGLITNQPQTRRKYFRTVHLTGHLGEGWEIELFIDQKLVDYALTNQNGDWEFELDIYYGTSLIMLKMYGPNGEIRTKEQYVRVPFNLIPKNTIEYTMVVGKSTIDSLQPWYGQTTAFYGLTERLTVGAGMDIPVGEEQEEPNSYSSEATVQMFSNLTLSGTYAPGYLARAALNFSKPSLISIDGSMVRFFENEFRNRLGQTQRALLTISVPLNLGAKRRVNLRYYLAWNKFPISDQITMHYGLNTNLPHINLFYLGKYQLNKQGRFTNRTISSELFASIHLHRRLRPQVRVVYDHRDQRLRMASLHINKRIFGKGQLSFSIEHDFYSRTNLFRVTFNLLTNFADFTTRAAYSDNAVTVTQVQRGSIRYDQQARNLILDRYFGVGRGIAVVRPFVDDNYNGRLDPSERLIPGLRATVGGGRERRHGKERTFYYDGLNPYDEHVVKIDEMSLDDPLLSPTYESYHVLLNPNMVTTINVPLVMTGEVDGMVRRQTAVGNVGQGGIKVIIFNMDKESITELTSFSSGEYFYLGLIPGPYRVNIDPEQLKRLGYRADPPYIEFVMETADGGAVVKDLNFLLIPIDDQ